MGELSPRSRNGAAQNELFEPPNAIDKKIAQAEARGQRITPWVRYAMHSWAARGVRLPQKGVPEWERLLYADIGHLPTPCDCSFCKQPAVIFPPEEDAPQGYCICPCCSLKGCPHKDPGERKAANA